MKNDFYFTLKDILLSKYLDFCLELLVMYKNGLIRKIRLNSNFMKSQPEKRTMTIHILPNASINKGNQTIRFGLLREYITWETLFLKNHTQDVVEKLPCPFSKKSKFSLSLDQYSEALYRLFLLDVKLRAIERYWN